MKQDGQRDYCYQRAAEIVSALTGLVGMLVALLAWLVLVFDVSDKRATEHLVVVDRLGETLIQLDRADDFVVTLAHVLGVCESERLLLSFDDLASISAYERVVIPELEWD